MRKLLCKLQYSIDVGIDFLVRNIDDDGYFCGEHDLSRHLLATCCLSEHLGKDERLMKPLSVVSSFSYYDNGRIFLSDEHLNSLAAISFLSCGRNDFGIGYLKSIKNNSAQDVEAFVVAFEKTEDKKIEEGKFGYKFEQVNLIEFLNDVLTEVLPQAKRAGIKIYFDRPEDELPKVYINRDKMLMVVYNFLDNAIRYNVENGEVRVKIEQVKGEPFIEVSVKDTGIGVPTGEINKLFSKFYRAENAVKFQTEGSGLGLYINKNIILAHGGKLWAESELNRGTTFHFTLPTSTDVIPDREVQVVG